MKLRFFILPVIVFLFLVGQGLNGLYAKKNSQWPYREYAYVKAYLYNLDNRLYGNHAIIKPAGPGAEKVGEYKLDETVIGEGGLLDKRRVETIVAVTNNDIRGLIEGLSKTYIPHHGFVFYDKNHIPVAYITLCFDCEALRVYPEKPVQRITRELSNEEIEKLLGFLDQYKRIVVETGLPVFDSPFLYREYGNRDR